MKKCLFCGCDMPDQAMLCDFCGSEQQVAVGRSSGLPQLKTNLPSAPKEPPRIIRLRNGVEVQIITPR